MPLSDVRIISVEQFGAGPWATLQLADLGADVIKVEDPGAGGDVSRYVPPYQEGEDSLFFETFNRNKRSVSLDLRTAAGREVLESSFTLLAQVDHVSLDDLLEARRVLEVPAARMAARRFARGAEASERLEALLDPSPAHLSRDEHFARNQGFHTAVLGVCGNSVMAIAAQPIFVVLQSHLVRADEAGDLQVGIDEQHGRIGEAILAGDEEAASREMHEHLDFLRPRYERVWRERAPRPSQA